MARLHCLRTPLDQVAAYLAAALDILPIAPFETVEGLSGIVMYQGRGGRRLRLMRWGFPRITRETRLCDEEPDLIGLVADLANPMWEHMVIDPRYRCIIPISHFANPHGELGATTRTWFRVRDQPVMAWAEFCRKIEGVGPVYAGLTMTANDAIPPTNNRIPVLLERAEIGRWLHGSIQDVIGFQVGRSIATERMEVIRTSDAWRSGNPPPSGSQLGLI